MQRQTQQTTNALQLIGKFVLENRAISVWLGSGALAGCLALSPLPYGQVAGAVIFSGASATAASHDAAQKRIKAAERTHEIDRSKFEADVRRLDKDKTAIAQAQTECAIKATQLSAIEASLATQQRTMKDRVMVEAHKDAQAKIEAMQARLEVALSDKAAMQATYQEKSSEMAKKTGLIVSQVEKSRKDLGDCAASTIATGNEVLAKERQQVNSVLENLGRDIKTMAAELASHKELVAKLQAPKQFKFKSFEADTANQIQAFLSSRGVVVGCDSIGKIHYGLTPIYFEPINCDLEAVKKQLEPLQLALGLSELPTAEIDNGKIKMVVQLSQDKTPKPAKNLVIVDPPLSKLERALDESIHARIVAQSGSGKTVLLGNLINYLTQQVSSDYVLSDPKVTAPENWGNLKPDYYSRECLQHFFELTKTCLTRIDEAAESVKATGNMPVFEYQFHVFDELEFLYGLSEVSNVKEYNSKMFKINAKSMLKVGREHKMKLLFVTQSPLPSDLNLRKNDFENCSSIFLGSQISAGLNSTDADGLLKDVPPEKIAQLKAEHRARMDRGDQYIYLFFNPAKPEETFFGRCPSPGHYAALKGASAPKNEASQSGNLGGCAPCHQGEDKKGQAVDMTDGAPATTGEGKKSDGGKMAQSGQAALGQKGNLAKLLKQGSHCPDCGHHSASYKKKNPSSTGKVSLRCKNKDCDRDSFSWKVA